MSENIIIKQAYFTNIKIAIDSINEYFSSQFKTKNFPDLDGDFVLESTIERIISRLNSVDPTWIDDPNKLNDILSTVSENIKNINPVDGVYQTIVNSNNKTMIDVIDSYVGFKMIQVIADHFQDFSKLINGIYTFELFMKPSLFTDVIDIFNKPIEFTELPELDLEEKIFDESIYVDGLMKMQQITFPDDMTIESETERISNATDLSDIEIFVDDSVQEAAEVNYFENTKPANIRYNSRTKKFIISREMNKIVDDIISALRKCDTTDDLVKYFKTLQPMVVNRISQTVIPFIFTKVITNKKKYNSDSVSSSDIENYTKSYDSIIEQNNGAKRFQNYDLFSTFKADKDGTIQFIEDFMKLNLVNNTDAYIANNTLLTIFNIFDSRIYLDIVYNMLPEENKKDKTEDAFVKEIRSRINKNSRSKNAYKDDNNVTEETPEDNSEKTVNEYVSNILKTYRNASISDMIYCEEYYDMLMKEINSVDNRIYNAKISPFAIDEYIGESYTDINDHLDDVFTEANIHKRRETLQSAVSALMSEMERIVELDKKHQWNNNNLVNTFKTSAGFMFPVIPNLTGSTKAHTDIKQVYALTRKAVKGKCGNFSPSQMRTLSMLNTFVGNIWADVKIFWANPLNWTKRVNLFNNDKITTRVKNIAITAKQIVGLKKQLEFIQDNDFINEAWYDGSPDYIYQEATTEENHKRVNLAIKLLMNDMRSVVDLVKKHMWTNNACVNKFKRKSEAYVNLKQAIKYTNRAIAGACGYVDSMNKSTLESFLEKQEELLKTIKIMNANIANIFGSNIKESKNTHKIATLANDILGMESEIKFIEKPPVKKKEESSDEIKQESVDLSKLIMEEWHGEIPDYMKTRLKLSDEIGQEKLLPKPELIRDVPQNDLGQLGDSINSRLDAGGSELGDMIGSGFENNPNKDKVGKNVVINITNNYTNSFNKDSNNTTTTTNTIDDKSTGKVTTTNTSNSNNSTNSHNDSSTNKKVDNSSRKSMESSTNNKKGSNNNNNSDNTIDSKDFENIVKTDNVQTFSSGKSVQEMFMILESSEPQSTALSANYPKQDSMTRAMDRDRRSLARQQKMKKGVQKITNTGKAIVQPISRTKQWLRKQVDSLIRRDEDQVKTEIFENNSYRSSVFKAMRLALSLGMIGLAFTIQPFIGVIATGYSGLRMVDKNRLKKEAQAEIETEIKVCDEKIRDLDNMRTPGAQKEKYEYMRMKSFLENQLTEVYKTHIKHPRNTW